MSLITCENLTKFYRKGQNKVITLSNLDLEVPRGEFLALMGPSGSGKTTLLNLISGIDTPSSGRLFVAGTDLSQLNRSQITQWRAQHCGYIFQLYHLIPILNAWENIELPLLLDKKLSASQRAAKVDAVLDLVGLSDRARHSPSELSGVQEQRVAIARALVTDPDLLVADEPTGDLDATSATHILQLLKDLVEQQNKTLVMVTHDQRAASYAARTLHLDKGKLVEQEAIA